MLLNCVPKIVYQFNPNSKVWEHLFLHILMLNTTNLFIFSHLYLPSYLNWVYFHVFISCIFFCELPPPHIVCPHFCWIVSHFYWFGLAVYTHTHTYIYICAFFVTCVSMMHLCLVCLWWLLSYRRFKFSGTKSASFPWFYVLLKKT